MAAILKTSAGVTALPLRSNKRVAPVARPVRARTVKVCAGVASIEPSKSTKPKHNRPTDQLTHTVEGEYTTGIFYLVFGAMFLMPVIFPGYVWIAQGIADLVGIPYMH